MTKTELFEIHYDVPENIIETLCDYFPEVEEVDEILSDYDYMLYYNCYSMTDVAIEIAEETGMFNNCNNELLERYFDYEAWGRDLEVNGYFLYAGNGLYIEVLR